jgi:hypothetical protein
MESGTSKSDKYRLYDKRGRFLPIFSNIIPGAPGVFTTERLRLLIMNLECDMGHSECYSCG